MPATARTIPLAALLATAALATALLTGCDPGSDVPAPSDPATPAASSTPETTDPIEPEPSEAPDPALGAADRENLADAIRSGNTAAVEGYFSDPVRVIIMASECCFDISPAEAVNQLSYVTGAAAPWDFDLPATTLDTWRTGWYSEQFTGDEVAGLAADGTLIVFGITGDRVTHVLMGFEEIVMG